MNTQSLLFLTLAISAIALILGALSLYLQIKNERVRKNFYAGDQPVNLEQILSNHANLLKSLQDEQINLEQEIQRLIFNSNSSVQKTGVVRFNTFDDSGGNLSFSLALLDAGNSGFIITSMFGREQNRIYAKPIIKGQSEFTLTKEEQNAIEIAIREWKTKIVQELPNKNKRRAKA